MYRLLRYLSVFVVVLIAQLSASVASAENSNTCARAVTDLSPVRTVTIDTTNGPIFGELTRQEKEPRFLKSKEVVLTFDDGPMPWITKSILDTLDDFCTKATFFSVGRMALAYPETMREVVERGHTLGTHTMTHPFNMHRLAPRRAHSEIERGFAAVALAAGVPIAPFFRFPGLADSGALLTYLKSRQIAAFTVDVVSNDSYIRSSSALAQRTLREIERADGGIVLFHDIKSVTAKALPTILKGLKARGYKIVHMLARDAFEPLPEATASVEKSLKTAAKTDDSEPERLPFYGRIGPITDDEAKEAADALIVPPVRDRASPRKSKRATRQRTDDDADTSSPNTPATHRTKVRRKQVKRAPQRRVTTRKPPATPRGGYQRPFTFQW